jgi:hypothetical protein
MEKVMKKVLAITAAAALMSFAFVAPVDAKATGADKQPVVREWTDLGDEADGEVIGFSNLVRKPSGISGTTHVQGLMPGGVYTFWMVAIDPDFFPAEVDFTKIFVDKGNAAVIGGNGRATVHWSAAAGDPSIMTPGPVFDDALEDIDERIMRIEIAYHGQADAAPDQATLDEWLSDFWSGDPTVCANPPFTPGNILPPAPQGAVQPHCPVNFASTHVPG